MSANRIQYKGTLDGQMNLWKRQYLNEQDVKFLSIEKNQYVEEMICCRLLHGCADIRRASVWKGHDRWESIGGVKCA